MTAKKKTSLTKRPERRMDRTGAGRNLLASMTACRSAIGMYVSLNRAGRGQRTVANAVGVSPTSLSNLEIGKGKVSRADVLALMTAMEVPEGQHLSQLYAGLTNLIEAFNGSFE